MTPPCAKWRPMAQNLLAPGLTACASNTPSGGSSATILFLPAAGRILTSLLPPLALLWSEADVLKLGVIINPFAGLGGSVALKGTDGAKVRDQAILRGAQPRAVARMRRALAPLQGTEVQLYGFAGEMAPLLPGRWAYPFTSSGRHNPNRVARTTAALRRPG